MVSKYDNLASVSASERRLFLCLFTPFHLRFRDVFEAEASDQAGLASWVANIRAAADEMATRIADMLMHMGGD